MPEHLTAHELELAAMAMDVRAANLKRRTEDRGARRLATECEALALKLWRMAHDANSHEPVKAQRHDPN